MDITGRGAIRIPGRLPLLIFAVLISACNSVYAQPASLPTVSFTLDFPGSVPDHYSITVDSAGHATYKSGQQRPEAKKEASPPADSVDSDQMEPMPALPDEPFEMSFVMSEVNRDLIFRLAERAGYFAGHLDYGKGKIANTGIKTLAYTNGERVTQASFNYTTKLPAQELTSLFQNISSTLEFGRRLQHFHRYQKLALDEELKRMEEMSKQHALDELQAVAPILKEIVADNAVINVSRARAERLLAKAGAAR
jgi:hypothetical protein